MEIKRGHVYIVDFNPRVRTKPGKLRPAVVLQSDLVNEAGYPSTIVIPTKPVWLRNLASSACIWRKAKPVLSGTVIFLWAS